MGLSAWITPASGGRFIYHPKSDLQTAIARFNSIVADDPRVEQVMPARDGLIIRRL